MDFNDLEWIATGRKTSLFESDMISSHSELLGHIKGSSIVVIGAAGSIGSSVVKLLLKFQPKRMALIDLNENALVEITRDIRSDPNISNSVELQILPIAMGSYEFSQFFAETKSFDYVLNFCAIKHVRSEKDKYSLIRMIDTNNLFLHDFLLHLKYPLKKFFSVSSDKAVNPANLMGASKQLMEAIMQLHGHRQSWSSARFANVSFSLGSLLEGFLYRMKKKQPLAAPTDIKRYFISHQEAAELCLLSLIKGKTSEIFFPKLQNELNENSFSEIAIKLLEKNGYTPYLCESEMEAKAKSKTLIAGKQWPCFFSPSNTEGEKPFEEFFTVEDDVDFSRFQSVGVTSLTKDKYDAEMIRKFLAFHEKSRKSGSTSKEDYINFFAQLITGFHPVISGKTLDEKM